MPLDGRSKIVGVVVGVTLAATAAVLLVMRSDTSKFERHTRVIDLRVVDDAGVHYVTRKVRAAREKATGAVTWPEGLDPHAIVLEHATDDDDGAAVEAVVGLCACRPIADPGACKAEQLDGKYAPAQLRVTLQPGTWRGPCEPKVCSVFDGDERQLVDGGWTDLSMPEACR